MKFLKVFGITATTILIVLSIVVFSIGSLCILDKACISTVGLVGFLSIIYSPFWIMEINDFLVAYVQPFCPFGILLIVLVVGFFSLRSDKDKGDLK